MLQAVVFMLLKQHVLQSVGCGEQNIASPLAPESGSLKKISSTWDFG